MLAVYSAIENPPDQTIIVHAQPSSIRSEISAGNDLRVVILQAGGRRRTVVMLVPIRRDDERIMFEHAKVKRQGTHSL
jgi:hypothetical protein